MKILKIIGVILLLFLGCVLINGICNILNIPNILRYIMGFLYGLWIGKILAKITIKGAKDE